MTLKLPCPFPTCHLNIQNQQGEAVVKLVGLAREQVHYPESCGHLILTENSQINEMYGLRRSNNIIGHDTRKTHRQRRAF